MKKTGKSPVAFVAFAVITVLLIACKNEATHLTTGEAKQDSLMSHIAINPNTEKGIVDWKQPVTDEEYNKFTKD